jgi:hypothetical protein
MQDLMYEHFTGVEPIYTVSKTDVLTIILKVHWLTVLKLRIMYKWRDLNSYSFTPLHPKWSLSTIPTHLLYT